MTGAHRARLTDDSGRSISERLDVFCENSPSQSDVDHGSVTLDGICIFCWRRMAILTHPSAIPPAFATRAALDAELAETKAVLVRKEYELDCWRKGDWGALRLDGYERDNLLCLIEAIRTGKLPEWNTGDWVGQLAHKLRRDAARNSISAANLEKAP